MSSSLSRRGIFLCLHSIMPVSKKRWWIKIPGKNRIRGKQEDEQVLGTGLLGDWNLQVIARVLGVHGCPEVNVPNDILPQRMNNSESVMMMSCRTRKRGNSHIPVPLGVIRHRIHRVLLHRHSGIPKARPTWIHYTTTNLSVKLCGSPSSGHGDAH